jgi:hypothetical protein
MMRKRLLLLFICCFAGYAILQAQVTIALQVPPTGVMLKKQLWNMALVYTGDADLNVTIQLTLLSGKDNQAVMTATSGPVSLKKGTNAINARDVSPLEYNYLSPLFNVDRDPDGFLPAGNYKACYTVIQPGHAGYPMTEDCIPVEIQPLSPPQLQMPSDTATIETAYPQFSWLPPVPLTIFSNLSYDMLVVEVLPGQGAYEAIQQNIPVYNISDYKNMVHLYPTSNKSLDTGRIYAWRVIAKNEGDFIAQSEVWSFKLATPKAEIIKPADGVYVQLHKPNDGVGGVQVITERIIGLKYYSYEKEHETRVQFVTSDGKVVKTIQEKIRYGENFLAYKLDGAFEKGKLYRAEITDQQNNRYTAGFTIK